jgi:hypothetical protein
LNDSTPGTDDPRPQREDVLGIAGFRDRAIALAGSAQMDLSIITLELDRRVYADQAFVDAVRVFALQHRRARVQVIVNSPHMRGGHRLVELGRILSSRIEFRQLPETRRDIIEECLIADERSVLRSDSFTQIEGSWFPDAPLEARSRLRAFRSLWEECVPAREYSILGI